MPPQQVICLSTSPEPSLNAKFTAFSKEVYALIISVPLHILTLIHRIISPMLSDEILILPKNS